MGYTHYWTLHKLEKLQTELPAVQEKLQKLETWIREHRPEIGFSMSYSDLPIEVDGPHENMLIGHKEGWDFCKTAAKPYDLVVCATLIILQHHLQSELAVTSDGISGSDVDEGWREAETLCWRLFGISSFLPKAGED